MLIAFIKGAFKNYVTEQRKESGLQKNDKNWHRGWCSENSDVIHTDLFLCPYSLQFTFRSSVPHKVLIMLDWTLMKTPLRAFLCVWYSYITRLKALNFNILTTWLVNTCVFMYKIENTNRLKLQLLTFSTYLI